MLQVILTHEQSDFDAAASELAAWLLNRERIPVLPKHKNHNLSAFLADYGSEFPFVSWNDVPKDEAAELLLTDCQIFNQNSRITESTRISVVDHHQPRENLPETWHCRFERLGSCTAILTEDLRAADIRPSQLQASLMLLGIYDDTGMLCYGSTTPRDVSAAAWLIEQGGNLDLVRRYLTQPLTETQLQGFDALLRNCDTYEIEDQHIIICSADVRELNDEFAAVAHRLRDMLYPDALILLLASKNGIRLIGRATTDRVDVGALMKRFNGGGHTRAAAGLVNVEDKEQILPTLERLRQDLPEMIRDYIMPPLRVGQIMSLNPLLLRSDMPIGEVLDLMSRYGYEGYPVVDAQRRVLGLLNARNVWRAGQFHLDITVESIYEPGHYAVQATDSVDYLKQLMQESGWGQVPVIDEGQQVIGIVTRTDLIKALLKPDSLPGSVNLGEKLRESLSAGSMALIQAIGKTAHACHYPVYIVGGFVRDLILERPVMDFDIVVEGDAIHLGHTLVNAYGGKLLVHSQFGTAKWLIRDIAAALLPEDTGAVLPDSLDLISSRTEFYEHPTALPEVERSSIKQDLHRRDFTINTMAIRLDGEHFGDLLDYWGGMTDIHRKNIRVLHSLSFTDDPTRMTRAVRFASRFHFNIEERTLSLIEKALPLLDQVSGQRLLHEFMLFFKEEHPEAGFARLRDLGILSRIHPDLTWTEEHGQRWNLLRKHQPEDFWQPLIGNDYDAFMSGRAPLYAWWGNLSPRQLDELGKKFALPLRTLQGLKALSFLERETKHLEQCWPGEATGLLDKAPLISVYAYYCLYRSDKLRDMIRAYVTEWRLVRPVTTGADLQKMGYPAGPWIAAVLERLRSAWLDEEIDTAADELKLLRTILPNHVKALEK